MCDMTHSYVWHDSFTCATWLLHLCDMTLIHMWILRWLWVRDIQMTHWLWDVLITHRVEFFSFFLWWGESDLSLRTLKYLGPTLTFFRAIYEPRPHIVFGFGSVIICTRVRECMRVCVCATKVDSDGDRNCQVRVCVSVWEYVFVQLRWIVMVIVIVKYGVGPGRSWFVLVAVQWIEHYCVCDDVGLLQIWWCTDIIIYTMMLIQHDCMYFI